ncbi:MAG: oxidative damage protection protein [Gammaproteobacteria bacterium]|jgi:Fe-S cluster biosynthesis and repair protein YggX|nr:oxidative damage protection protein [Gammaproteobacteria bacterium]
MTNRLVNCRKYGKPLPGLTEPPMPTDTGQEIYEHVSAQAWSEWQELQTMLINEHHLSLLEPSARNFLSQQMEKFLSNGDFEKPEGYTPVS